jgi:hypothetical protein
MVCIQNADGSVHSEVISFGVVPCEDLYEAMEYGVIWYTDPAWRGVDELGIALFTN